MKNLFLVSLVFSLLLCLCNITFAAEQMTLQKLPDSSYSKLCYKGKCALYDNFDDETVTDLQYDDIALLKDTPYAKVQVHGKWALYYLYADTELTLPVYDDIAAIGVNGGRYVAVRQGNHWAIFFTDNLKPVTGFIYDDFLKVESDWFEDLYKVKSFGKYGFVKFHISKQEKCDFDLVPAIYDDAQRLTPVYYKVKEGNKWALYDVNKKSTVTLFDYDDIKNTGDYNSGLKNGSWSNVKIIR